MEAVQTKKKSKHRRKHRENADIETPGPSPRIVEPDPPPLEELQNLTITTKDEVTNSTITTEEEVPNSDIATEEEVSNSTITAAEEKVTNSTVTIEEKAGIEPVPDSTAVILEEDKQEHIAKNIAPVYPNLAEEILQNDEVFKSEMLPTTRDAAPAVSSSEQVYSAPEAEAAPDLESPSNAILDPCEEAFSMLATAPPNIESVEFYSFPEATTSEVLKNDYQSELPKLQEEVETEQIQMCTRPRVASQIKSLYNNYLLENNKEFVNQFVDSIQTSHDGFELFELLSNYLRACNQLTLCEKSLSTLKDNCDEFEKQVWTLAVKQLSENAQCDDGNNLVATYKVHTSEFNQQIFLQLNRTLKDIKELLQDSFSLHTYSVQLSKSQINHFFYKSFGNFNLQTFQVQSYSPGYPTQDVRAYANLLKKAISVIFHFIRKPLVHACFVQDCQDWIQKCGGLLLRIATIEDHIFLLNHVLRCPPKVISKWAAKLIQIPGIPILSQPCDYSCSFAHIHLDYSLTVLSTILSSVPKRSEILNQYKIAANNAIHPADTSLQWVLIDSDGEDDPEDICSFKESDLIALLQQVPFDQIFRRVLLICSDGGEDIHDIRFCSDHSVLKLIAFATHLVEILGNGFTTYYTDRFRQLVKLIGRLILHTIQYVTDQVEFFTNANSNDIVVVRSITEEYDIFLLEAVTLLISARNIGSLQFLAAVPYHLVSTEMLWEIYSLLTKWNLYENSNRGKYVSIEFEHELLAISESNTFYILTTMSNMAIARERQDDFVKIVTLHLFQIGFLSPITRDACSKNARDLLGSLTRKYPTLISILIQNIKPKMELLDKMSLFLLRELAFNLWKPTEVDFQVLSQWLVNFQSYSLENQVGRFIIHSMNWDFGDDGQLYLPYELHCKVALLVVESHFKWERNQGVLSESVKQISAWVTRNPDFTSWAWETIKRLHLHAYDRSNLAELRMSEIMRNLPTFESHSELESLKKAVDEKNPIACTVALLMTPLGHSMPVLCTSGFELLETLIQNYKYDTVINLFFVLMPLFAGSRDSILTNEKFRKILSSVLAADMTYVRMAKNLITADFPGVHTKQFGDMLQSQLYQYTRFSTTEKRLVCLWVELLTKLENWNKDNNVLYLLNILARFSFSRAECSTYFRDYWTALYKELPSQNSSGIASLFFGWSSASTTLLPNTSYPQMPYLAYYNLQVEMELENQSGFWKSLNQFLSSPSTVLEGAVKKAASSSKFATSSNYLSIYRWAQQAADMPDDHPLIFVFWQYFFMRYFHRIGVNDKYQGGVGERFFEGMINTGFLKKLKKRLHDLLNHFNTRLVKLKEKDEMNSEDNVAENTGLLMEYLQNCWTLANAMTLWIEDPQYHKESLYLPALPPQCLPSRLLSLVEGDFRDWIDYVDYEEINALERKSDRTYLTLINRLCWIDAAKIVRSRTWSNSLFGRREEFLKRLNSYDKPVAPPPVPVFTQVLPTGTAAMFTDLTAMHAALNPQFQSLVEFAKLFMLQASQHTALDCAYCDHLPDLYTIVQSEATVNVRCSSGKRIKTCSGAAHVVFQFSEARLNERVGHLIHQNRTDYHTLISQHGLQPPPPAVCIAAVFIEDFITNLIILHRSVSRNSREYVKTQQVGTELFYYIVHQIVEDTNFYPPTRQLFSSFIEVLGQEFIGNVPAECKRLVQTCIRNSHLSGVLAPHINLITTNPETLIEIYQDIVNIPRRDGDLAFVVLTKLDLVKWLSRTKPKISERSHLISHIWRAITAQGLDQGDSNPMVHEIYRSHLKILLLHEFPTHYGEILNYLLEATEKQTAPLEIWYDFFNALSRDSIRFGSKMDPFERKRELKRFSMEMDTLRHDDLLETAQLLGRYFTKERLAYGLYGLYPKYRTYIEPLSSFVQMISYTVIASSLKHSSGRVSKQITEVVWPIIRDLYAPWILPYDQRTLEQHGAQWIQQMNFDSGTSLQPWIPADTNLAMLFMNDFTDSVLFLAETLPGCSLLFSNLWNFYVENYAQVTVKEHVLSVVHNCFISIPWGMFWPTVSDVELMNKVVETYLPACHNFLSVMFAQINWSEWIGQFSNVTPTSAKNKCHAILLNLTVHLSTDIVARESPTWITVLQTSHNLNWQYVMSNSLEPILNWFVMSIDPRVVLGMDVIHHLDKASFHLLKLASGYGLPPQHSTETAASHSPRTAAAQTDLNRKRYLFVRSYARLIVSASTKYKNLLQANVKNFEKAFQNILDDIVFVVKDENQPADDFMPHLREVLLLMTNHHVGTVARNAFIKWCDANKDAPLRFLTGMISTSFSAKVPPYITVPLIEEAILLAFLHKECSWDSISKLALIPQEEQTDLIKFTDVASKDGHFLVLYTLLLKRYPYLCNGGMMSVTSLTDLLKNIKPKESNEAALPLLYGFMLKVTVHLLNDSDKIPGLEKCVKKFLNSFALHLTSVGDDKQGWALLGVLGLTKASELSVRGRLFARCLSLFVISQMPLNAPIRLTAESKGHFLQGAEQNSSIKPHGELESSIEKMETLKLNRQYSELIECIESAVDYIREPDHSLSSFANFIDHMTCQLFTEPYLLHHLVHREED